MKKPWISKGILKAIEKKNRIYKKCIRTKTATKPLQNLLINLTFTKGKFPDILKIVKKNPIQKKNCKTDVNNCRPISLLSNISKIIEKIVHDRLYMYLENNSFFYKYQLGFRANHSRNYALTEITLQIRNASDKGLYTCGVYLDLQKAFATVNQNILLAKLKHYDIKGGSFD